MPGHFDNAEALAVAVDPEHTQYSQPAIGRRVDEASVEWLRWQPGKHLGPDPMLRHKGVVCRGRTGIVCLRLGRRRREEVEWHLQCRLTGIPVEVRVVNQGGELVDAFSESLFRAKLAEKGDDLSQHEKSIAIARVMTTLLERQANSRKNLLRGRTEHEIERGEPHAEI
jgi:hypothetical protein